MKILYFGSYNPGYSRNRVLMKGLRQNSVEVFECRTSRHGILAFFELFFKHLGFIGKYDLMMVGFPGQEMMFLAKLVSRKPIIFDAFTSHYGGYVLDRKKFAENGPRAKYFKFLDRWSCRFADLVLLDTEAHIDFFVREFGLPKDKFLRIFVGTDSDVFYPREPKNLGENFIVHFHGNYIPLQGVKYIIEAAEILKGEDIEFNLIGRGQTFKSDSELVKNKGLKNINFIEPVPYDKLAEYITRADVCLGIFGDSPKTGLVIPNKAYEAIAMAKPLITADTPAVHELLTDRVNVFLCKKADSGDLARTLREVKENYNLAKGIAQNARKLFEEKLTETKLVDGLIKKIHERRIL